jgi:hypothetical protein
MWQPDYIQGGAHRYPFSIGENRLVADFLAQRPNIAGAQTYHNAGGMILRGPGAKEDSFEPADIQVYDVLGKKGAELLPGYRYMNVANELYEVWGGEIDWFHQVRGTWTFTNELFTPFNYFRTAGHQGFFGSDEVQHQFNKYLLLDDGSIPWHEVDHPTYGKVEVGGFTKNWVRQPPSFLLEEECHRNMAFAVSRRRIAAGQGAVGGSKDLGGDVRQVTAIVENVRRSRRTRPPTCGARSRRRTWWS